MSKVIGITGSIACGKSYVSKYLSNLGYEVIDTDIISHEITQDNSIYLSDIKKHFPTCVKNGKLQRKELSNIIFNDKSKREELNNILHPIIFNQVKTMINKSQSDIIFLDVPLMFEAHFDVICDKIICVYTDLDIQIERLIKRDNIKKEDAIKKINSQMKLKDKMELCDYLIYSINDYDIVNQNILNVLNKIKEDFYA